ncbi:hypothetical protein GCM10009798_09210 [Nocardioides panacihumi]|uniref:HNH nuclease domain-containing protein n=1 Tax=Nocardioides panacihumi TaxID=400774 RepID=A0ABN2QGW3_9ACTN
MLGALAVVEGALRDVAGVNPTFMEPDAQRLALVGLAAARARLDELELRLISAAAEVAATDAARDVAGWLVAHTRRDIRTARADARLAEALDRRYEVLRVAMAQGRVHAEQAHVIAHALDGLPGDLDPAVLVDAEGMLVDLASRHTPRELRRLGQRILDTAAPDVAEQTLARRLEAEEASASRRTRLTLRSNGDGTTRISAVVPDAAALRLKTYLDAFTSPRQGATRGEGPYPRILGTAFCTFLERVDPKLLPRHGGRATTVVVTIPLQSLQQELGVGDLIGGEAVSATEVRRLACTAGIVPAVLGGSGEILDLGREQRLFTPAQHKALVIRDRTCRAQGCDIPGTWAEAHHRIPWSLGGKTDLANAVLLCSHHHHRVHDPRFTADRLPNGDVRFTRRR